MTLLSHFATSISENAASQGVLSSVHTELLAIAMQKWMENFAKEWVEYPFLAMPANAHSITSAQCERTLTD